MTPELARQLLAWISEVELVWERFNDQAIALYPLRECPAAVYDYLLDCHGPSMIYLAPTGPAVAQATVQGPIAIATLLVKQRSDNSGDGAEGGTQSSDEPTSDSSLRRLRSALAANLKAAPLPLERNRSSVDESEGAKRKASAAATSHRNTVEWKLCDLVAAKISLEKTASRSVERKRLLNVLIKSPIRRLPMVRLRHLEKLEGLKVDFPNFAPVIDLIGQRLRLQSSSRAALHFPPILLLGEPGVGKTAFARELATTLGMTLTFRSLADVTGGFLITGSAPTWNESAPGVVAYSLLDCPEGQAPLLVLDELDKARVGEHATDTRLLGLLEPSTAKTFRDEHLDLQLDASVLSVIITANRIGNVRPEVLSRLKIVVVEGPTHEQMPAIVRSVDRQLRAESPGLSKLFLPLGDDILNAFAAMPPRRVRRYLDDAYGKALSEPAATSTEGQPRSSRKKALTADQLQLPGSSKRHPDLDKVQPYVMPLYIPWGGGAWLH